MNERNKLLAEAFGECWHEWTPLSPVNSDGSGKGDYTCNCKKCSIALGPCSYSKLLQKRASNPDYFTPVTLKCDNYDCQDGKVPCDEYSPWESDEDGCGFGVCEIRCPRETTDCNNGMIPCPCQGDPRIISRLQHEIEKRGEWKTFVTLVILGEIEYDFYEPDLIKLCDAYLEWRK